MQGGTHNSSIFPTNTQDYSNNKNSGEALREGGEGRRQGGRSLKDTPHTKQ